MKEQEQQEQQEQKKKTEESNNVKMNTWYFASSGRNYAKYARN